MFAACCACVHPLSPALIFSPRFCCGSYESTVSLRARASAAIDEWRNDSSKADLVDKIQSCLRLLTVARCVKDVFGTVFVMGFCGAIFTSLIFPLTMYMLTPVRLPISHFIDAAGIGGVFSKISVVLGASGALFLLGLIFRVYYGCQIRALIDLELVSEAEALNP